VLSRIAESLYWIGRYVERVDGTARIVDVLRLQLVEAGGSREDSVASVALSVILGLRLQADSSFADVSRRMVFDLDQPGSISASWRDARENARRARETLSLEHWEAINTSWRHWCQLPQREVTSRHLGFARERTALIRGTADSTMSHDEAWEFLVLGRSLERADMTARIVATGALPQLGADWSTVLQAVGAQQAYLRSHRGLVTQESAAAFLILDRPFPRSVLHALSEAERTLVRLDPANSRVGIPDEARRRLGEIRTSLEYRPVEEVITDVPAQMRRVQRAVTGASEAVARRYFPSTPVTSWVEEGR
jgi:uncharacterized alpha-E superfamily protein